MQALMGGVRLARARPACAGLAALHCAGVLRRRAAAQAGAVCEVALELAQALAHLHSKSIIHGGEGGGAGRARERPFACALLPAPPTHPTSDLRLRASGAPVVAPLDGWMRLRVGSAACNTPVEPLSHACMQN